MISCEIYVNNKHSAKIIGQKLFDLCKDKEDIAFVFVGTDANIGDSLGPICGQITDFSDTNLLFYGSLSHTITAKDVPYAANYLKKAHPSAFVVIIDAALGNAEDIGTIKVCENGIKPGLGVNKDLPMIGNIGIIAVVGEKRSGERQVGVLRLGEIYKIAKTISDGIRSFIDLRNNFDRKNNSFIPSSDDAANL